MSRITRKSDFLHIRKQRRRLAAQLDSTFVFAIQMVQLLYFLNPILSLYPSYFVVQSGLCRITENTEDSFCPDAAHIIFQRIMQTDV